MAILKTIWIIVSNLPLILSVLIAVFKAIPGDEPDKTLEEIRDFIKKYISK